MIPDFDYAPPDVPLDILFQDDLILVVHPVRCFDAGRVWLSAGYARGLRNWLNF